MQMSYHIDTMALVTVQAKLRFELKSEPEDGFLN
jgi:hypothetical protein